MVTIDQRFQHGLDCLRNHQFDLARRDFTEILQQDIRHEQAWIHYAQTFPALEQRLQILEKALLRDPAMQQVARTVRLLKRAQQSDLDSAAVPEHASEPHSVFPMLLIVLLFLVMLISGMLGLYAQKKIQELQREQQRIEMEYNVALLGLQDVIREKNQLQADHDLLQNDNTRLASENINLLARTQDLEIRLDQLNQAHRDLLTQSEQLQGSYSSLVQSFDQFQRTAITPPYITIAKRMVTVAFFRLDGTLWNWQFSFDQLERQIEQGYAFRYYYEHDKVPYTYKHIYKSDDGTLYAFPDYVQMVSAEPFAGYIEQLYYAAPDEQQFLREIWYISAQITSYAKDPELDVDHPRMPLETFLAGGGDCEDTAILFASLVKAAPTNWSINLILMNSDEPTSRDISGYNHMAVSVNTGSREYVVETTSHTEMTPYNAVGGTFLPVP